VATKAAIFLRLGARESTPREKWLRVCGPLSKSLPLTFVVSFRNELLLKKKNITNKRRESKNHTLFETTTAMVTRTLLNKRSNEQNNTVHVRYNLIGTFLRRPLQNAILRCLEDVTHDCCSFNILLRVSLHPKFNFSDSCDP